MDSKTPFFDSNSAEDEINAYFDTLPKNIQETIIQAHSDVSSLSELKSIASNLMAK